MGARTILMSLLMAGLAAQAALAMGPTVNVSGGGTGVLSAAFTANNATGAELVIQDSGVYTETSILFVSPRNHETLGRRSFGITAAPGQTPTIIINGGMLMYAGGADVQIGSNEGGRITIDARNAIIGGTNGAIWYIGQEDGLASGQACQATFENLEINFRGRTEGFVFGAGGNDATPNTTGASLTLNNVETQGGGVVLAALYPPTDYPSTLNINNSQIMDIESTNVSGSGVVGGAYQLGGPNSLVNITRSIIFAPSTTQGPFESNLVLGVRGQINIDHSDIISLASTTAGGNPVTTARAVTGLETGNIAITNSIIHGEVGTAHFGTGTATVVDSNVTAEGVLNAGFEYTNTIEEWPVFVSVGSDPADPNFVLLTSSLSATHGSQPPIGAKGDPIEPPTPARHWSIYN